MCLLEMLCSKLWFVLVVDRPYQDVLGRNMRRPPCYEKWLSAQHAANVVSTKGKKKVNHGYVHHSSPSRKSSLSARRQPM
jgi:hypothetical protein